MGSASSGCVARRLSASSIHVISDAPPCIASSQAASGSPSIRCAQMRSSPETAASARAAGSPLGPSLGGGSQPGIAARARLLVEGTERQRDRPLRLAATAVLRDGELPQPRILGGTVRVEAALDPVQGVVVASRLEE